MMFLRFLACLLLLSRLATILSADESKEALLIRASHLGDLSRVESLLAERVDVEATDALGLTALQHAQSRGREAIVERLRAAGADEDRPWPPLSELVQKRLAQRVSGDAPAVAVLVARDGKILASAASGFASLEHHVPATTRTKFRIGSVTKQFTAAAILRLQEQGKLSVDDPLEKYFPGYRRGDEIKIHHLLTHTSGIVNYTDDAGFYGKVSSPIESDVLIDSFRKKSLEFDPGQRWKYSNSGYFLLGRIIEIVSQQAYGDYLRTTFFEPLQMRDTGVHRATDVIPHEATGYAWNSERFAYDKALNWDMAHAGGAGALYSTVEDLFKWNEALFGGQVLSSATLERALTPVVVTEKGQWPEYGFGWMRADVRGLRVITHGGGLQGFSSVLTRVPDKRVTLVALVAALPGSPGLDPDELHRQLGEWVLWKEMKPVESETATTVTLDAEALDELVGEYDYLSAIMRVRRDGTRLLAQLTGQPEYEIFPINNEEFVWKVVEAKVRFVRDEQGKVVHAVHKQNGREFEAPRMGQRESVVLEPEKLDDYVGRYNYGLRIMVLTVTKDQGRLFARMTGQNRLEIVPMGEDRFFWRDVNAEVKFERDESGKVVKAVHTQAGRTTEAPKID